MTQETTDIRSNPIEQIKHAAEIIMKSKDRKLVFEAVYSTKQKIKTVTEISKKTGLERIRVLQEAGNLSNNSIVQKTKVGKELAYEKDKFFTQHKTKILSLAGNKDKIAKLVTRSSPQTSMITMTVPIQKQKLKDKFITIDEIDSFLKVCKIKKTKKNIPIYEKDFKIGIQKILNQGGTFKDWGGEKNDLLSSRLILNRKRKRVAFGFKGRGVSGVLTPKKMGKNGDQIQRLFESSADVFLFQYWNIISEKVLEQMEGWAQLKSYKENREIYFGIIDGHDTQRIIEAYKEKFPNSEDN